MIYNGQLRRYFPKEVYQVQFDRGLLVTGSTAQMKSENLGEHARTKGLL